MSVEGRRGERSALDAATQSTEVQLHKPVRLVGVLVGGERPGVPRPAAARAFRTSDEQLSFFLAAYSPFSPAHLEHHGLAAVKAGGPHAGARAGGEGHCFVCFKREKK